MPDAAPERAAHVMPAPAPSASVPAASVPAASVPAASGTLAPAVVRPEPGLARGLVETTPWVVYALSMLVVALGLLYGARRLGLLRKQRR